MSKCPLTIDYVLDTLLMRPVLRYVFVALFAVVSAHLQGQAQRGIVRGTVTDSATGTAIPFANIRVEGTDFGTACDAKGYYVLPSLPLGRYEVTASVVGYHSQTKSIRIFGGGITICDFQLQVSPIQLGAVERIGERRESASETNISIETVGRREFELSPTPVQPDVFRTLMTLPGVQTTSDISTQFYIRGGSGDQNLIYLDGMPIYNPFHALGLFSIFDGSSVRAAELYKGGFGAEYGGRLSSVLNIITRQGNKNRFGGNVGMGLVMGRALFEGPLFWKGSSWLLAGRKSFFGAILNRFIDTRNYPFNFYDAVANLDIRATEKTHLGVHGFFTGDRLTNVSLVEPDYEWYTNAISIDLRQIFLEGQFYGDLAFSETSFRGSLNPKFHPSLKPMTSSVLDRMLRADATYVLGSGDQIGFGALLHIVDVGYSLVNSAGISLTNDDALPEGALYWKYKFLRLRNLVVDAGLRLYYTDLLDEAHAAFEPRLSFRYHLSRSFAVKGAYGVYHQRLITLSNEDNLVNLFEMWYALPPSKGFPAEEARHYVLGAEITFSSAFDVSIEAYEKPMNVLIGYNLDKVDRYDPDLIEGTGAAAGLEILLRYQFPTLQGWISYAYSKVMKAFNNVAYPPRYDRRHDLHIIAGWAFAPGWELSAQWEYGSGLPFTQIAGYYDRIPLDGILGGTGYILEPGAPFIVLGEKNAGRLPVYHRLDIGIQKKLEIGEIKLVVKGSIINVYNRKNLFYFDRATGRQINMLPFLASFDLSAEF